MGEDPYYFKKIDKIRKGESGMISGVFSKISDIEIDDHESTFQISPDDWDSDTYSFYNITLENGYKVSLGQDEATLVKVSSGPRNNDDDSDIKRNSFKTKGPKNIPATDEVDNDPPIGGDNDYLSESFRNRMKKLSGLK
jgi:hypothetical protein